MADEGDEGSVAAGYTAIDFVIGLVLALGSSALQALGLNLAKLDLARNAALPPSERRSRDWTRPLWLAGMALYILSQVVGQTLALNFLRSEYVAPLGSASLIFNFVFAKVLVGTSISRLDLYGTATVIVGVVGVVVFSNQRREGADDPEARLDAPFVAALWSRPQWIVYFVARVGISLATWWLANLAADVCAARVDVDRSADADDDPSYGSARHAAPASASSDGSILGRARAMVGVGKARERVLYAALRSRGDAWARTKSDIVVRQLAGFAWALAGGLLAGATLVFAKSAVKSIAAWRANDAPSPFAYVVFYVVIALLGVCGVAQVAALNAGLRACDSTFVVPVFFAAYTCAGFWDALVYLDTFETYETWAFALCWVAIAVLVAGVGMLSLKKPAAEQRKRPTFDDEGDETTARVDDGLGDDYAQFEIGDDEGEAGGKTRASLGGERTRKSTDQPPV